jgi:hypothetical protein
MGTHNRLMSLGPGAFPTLIQWEGDRHPAASLPDSGCRLERLAVRHPRAQDFEAALRALGLREDAPVRLVASDATGISAVLRSPRGTILLPESPARE